jgi:hypothetical protein
MTWLLNNKQGKGKDEKPFYLFHHATCSRTSAECHFSHAPLSKAEKDKLEKPVPKSSRPSSPAPSVTGKGKGKGKTKDGNYCFAFADTGVCTRAECVFPHLNAAEVAAIKLKKAQAKAAAAGCCVEVSAVAVEYASPRALTPLQRKLENVRLACSARLAEVCAPATTLQQIHEVHRIHRVACAQTHPVQNDLIPEASSEVMLQDVAAAKGDVMSTAAMSSEVISHDINQESDCDYKQMRTDSLDNIMPFPSMSAEQQKMGKIELLAQKIR